MKVKCSKCGAIFEATGQYALLVMSGGMKCPECKGIINIILGKVKP
jgi:DNA-directed RNA polymerase subunit RPC12/RpoP